MAEPRTRRPRPRLPAPTSRAQRTSPRAVPPRGRGRAGRARPRAPRAGAALDAALRELGRGPHRARRWRGGATGRCMLGLERLLAEDEPHLADGTVLSAHQVDALSGTLIALARRGGERSQRRAAAPPRPTSSCPRRPAGGVRRRGGRRGRRAPGLAGGRRSGERGGRSVADAARGPRREPALLVRARHRGGQDRRRDGLRGGLPYGRGADPHPPPQPRGPVHRRAGDRGYRKRVTAPLLDGQQPRGAGHRRDVPVVRAQRRADLRRLHDRHLRRGTHRARREDERGHPLLARPRLHRHDGHGRAHRPPRHGPLPDPDVALRPRAGRAPGRHRPAALRAHPARAWGCGRSPRSPCARARSTRTSTRRSWPRCSTRARSTPRSPISTASASRTSPAWSTPRASATPTTWPRRSVTPGSRRRPSPGRPRSAS